MLLDPAIDNWKVHHPNGELMFYCDLRRASWYLKKQLAQVLADGVIQLTFEPNGTGFKQDDVFGLSPRHYRCVCCGTDTGHLQRHHIVPAMYRKNMPDSYKSKNHHDVVLVCSDCHETYERSATELKKQLCEQYEVPFENRVRFVAETNRHGEPGDFRHVKPFMQALLGDHTRLQKPVRMRMVHKVSQYLGKRVFTRQDVETALDELNEQQRTQTTSGKLIVERVTDLVEFVMMWRQHFVDTMQPPYMPEGWSVERRSKLEELELK